MIYYAEKDGSANPPYRFEAANAYAAARIAGKYFVMHDLMADDNPPSEGERSLTLRLRPENSDVSVKVRVLVPFEYTLTVQDPTIENPQSLAKFAGM